LAASSTNSATFTISTAALLTPTVTAIPPASGPFTGGPFTATATVTGTGGVAINDGTVTFTYSQGGTTLGGAPTAPGTYSVVANFSGDTDYSAASSTNSATFTISTAALLTPTVTAIPPASGPFTGNPFTATATVTGTGGVAINDGTVTFTYSQGGTTLGGAPTAPGTYSVVANFSGDTDYSGASSTNSATFTIGQATPIVTAIPPASGPFTGNPFTATATVTGVGGATISDGTVTFTYKQGGTTLGSAPTAPGTYSVVANFSGDTDYLAASSTNSATFTIGQATPIVTAIPPASGPFTGNPFNATATVTGVGGATISDGTVTFTYKQGGTTLGGPPTAPGTYSVVANFSGDT
jgi:hypothetical protein